MFVCFFFYLQTSILYTLIIRWWFEILIYCLVILLLILFIIITCCNLIFKFFWMDWMLHFTLHLRGVFYGNNFLIHPLNTDFFNVIIGNKSQCIFHSYKIYQVRTYLGEFKPKFAIQTTDDYYKSTYFIICILIFNLSHIFLMEIIFIYFYHILIT